ncbi:MAG: hypothetical protein EAZ77_01380 [Nostocales cyanobacterium]|nr:MAG: hypothetical protein EAZ77_01380 [Nostocales cyanobacterium]
MYAVLLLTVFVNLIVALGVGVFIANILTIERLFSMNSDFGVAEYKYEFVSRRDAESKSLINRFFGFHTSIQQRPIFKNQIWPPNQVLRVKFKQGRKTWRILTSQLQKVSP